MFVAIGRVEIHMPATESLKEKRAILRSTTTRVRNQFPVAVAEVEAQQRHGRAVLGIAAVSQQAYHAREVVEAAIRFVEGLRLDADVTNVEIDVLRVL